MCCRRRAVGKRLSTGQSHLIFRVSHSKDKSRESKCSFGFYGPSGETRTRGILVPNQAPYQLGHTRKRGILYTTFGENATGYFL